MTSISIQHSILICKYIPIPNIPFKSHYNHKPFSIQITSQVTFSFQTNISHFQFQYTIFENKVTISTQLEFQYNSIQNNKKLHFQACTNLSFFQLPSSSPLPSNQAQTIFNISNMLHLCIINSN